MIACFVCTPDSGTTNVSFASGLAHSIDSNWYSIGAINAQDAPKRSRYFARLTTAISACYQESTSYEFLALWHIFCPSFLMTGIHQDRSVSVCVKAEDQPDQLLYIFLERRYFNDTNFLLIDMWRADIFSGCDSDSHPYR